MIITCPYREGTTMCSNMRPRVVTTMLIICCAAMLLDSLSEAISASEPKGPTKSKNIPKTPNSVGVSPDRPKSTMTCEAIKRSILSQHYMIHNLLVEYRQRTLYRDQDSIPTGTYWE